MNTPPVYPTAVAADAAARAINKLFRRLVSFLFVLFVFSFLDRINIGFAGLAMGADLGLTKTMFGMAAALFYLAYVCCGIPSNLMLSRVGARRWLAVIMVLWGIASTCTLFATGPGTLYLLRILVGIAEAGFLPGVLLYMTWWFPVRYRARANGLFMIAMPVTTLLGSVLSGYLLALDGLLNLKGWQWLFLVEGIPSVILGVVVWRWLDDKPQDARWLKEDEKQALLQLLEDDRQRAQQSQGQTSGRQGWRVLLAPTIVLYTLAYFCLTNSLSAISIWTPQILQSFNQDSSPVTLGLLAAIPQLCTIIGMLYWGRRSDRLRERKRHTWLPFLFAAAGWLLTSASHHPLLQLTGIVMASTGAFSAMVVFWTTPDRTLSPATRVVAIALINATGNIGSGVSPLFIGVLRDTTGSFDSGLWLMAFLLVVGSLVISRIPMVSSDAEVEPMPGRIAQQERV